METVVYFIITGNYSLWTAAVNPRILPLNNISFNIYLMKIITRKTCRLCGSNKLKSILNLGNLYVSTFVKSRKEKGMRSPLELVLCQNPKCDLLQLKHTAPQELMYSRHYWYESGINNVIVSDLKQIVSQTIKMAKPKKGDVFLDIGANDGTMLGFVPKKYIRVGCEPADNLQAKLRKNADYAIHDFWYKKTYDKLGLPKAKIITAIGMFYDMEDPSQFVRDAARVLADDGLFIAQMMTLKPMILKNDVGNICHEHLEFYSYPSLVYLFEKNGLEIFKVEENGINGGSYRLFARKLKKGSIKYRELKFDYKAFAKRLVENKKKTVEFIKKEVKKGKKVYAYGASTKGNTILQYYGLNSKLIAAAADKDPKKWGKFTVGTLVPIIKEGNARAEKPDYFFVLPWGFIESFKKKEREKGFFKRGGKFIVSIPKFKVIS
ncbi:MAG: methyltransferase domain-containing protein [Candidatus Liptonbacteria bacterium]|nr:methyltransferase domain-containing protein [Candidatus Liptonbacteria bacterium]